MMQPMPEPLTRMTLETAHTKAVVEVKRDLDIYEMVDDVIRPILLAAGYMESSVDEAIGPRG